MYQTLDDLRSSLRRGQRLRAYMLAAGAAVFLSVAIAWVCPVAAVAAAGTLYAALGTLAQ